MKCNWRAGISILAAGLVAFTANAGGNGVVFSVEQTKKVWGQSGAPAWTPDGKDIAALDSWLEAYVKSHPYAPKHYDGAVVSDALKYGRQYMGITKNRRKLIYLNAFCSVPKFWREKAVEVQGGGSCYFRVLFDPKTKRFSNLEYNAVK